MTRGRGGARRCTLLVFALVFACAPAALAVGAEPPPAPTATPGLALSTKPLPGCCCYPIAGRPGEWGCDWGLQEKKCRDVGTFLELPSRWTPGRCPEPDASKG
jgi:hypothetical protein